MTAVEVFIEGYAVAALSTVVILSFLGVGRIEIYLAFLALEFLAISEFNPTVLTHAESRRRNLIGLLLLAIFASIVIVRLLEILP